MDKWKYFGISSCDSGSRTEQLYKFCPENKLLYRKDDEDWISIEITAVKLNPWSLIKEVIYKLEEEYRIQLREDSINSLIN